MREEPESFLASVHLDHWNGLATLDERSRYPWGGPSSLRGIHDNRDNFDQFGDCLQHGGRAGHVVIYPWIREAH